MTQTVSAGAEPASPSSPSDVPFLSVVVPVYRTGASYLAAMIESVRQQRDPGWELILVDDGSADLSLTAALDAAASRDRRIRHESLQVNSGIVRASNHGLQVAIGELVALLDHDDLLAPDAVERCRSAIATAPDTDVLYSDETIIGPADEVLGEFRKPVFSPERLRGQMYTGHLGVYRRSLLSAIGGFREGFDGSQDYDLILRATERARAVRSIPASLYHWRTLPDSVSHAENNDYVFAAARRALTEHLERSGVRATVTQTDATGRYRIDRIVPDDASVSVILPSAGGRAMLAGVDQAALPAALGQLVRDCGDRLADITVIGGHGTDDPDVRDILLGRGRVMPVPGEPWSADAINRSVLGAKGDFVLLIGDSVRPITGDWLPVLLGLALDPGVGVVGPRVLRWDGRVAAAGLAVVGAGMFPIGSGSGVADPGPFGALQLDREVTGLPADCILVRRSLFLRAGGLSLAMAVPAGIVDLSMKLAELGYRTVVSAASDVEVAMRATVASAAELGPLRERWGARLAFDSYWRDT